LEKEVDTLKHKHKVFAEMEHAREFPELTPKSVHTELEEAQLLNLQLWALVEIQMKDFETSQLQPTSEETRKRTQADFVNHMGSILRELEALRQHIELLEGSPARDFFTSEDAKLNIGTAKHRAKVLISCDGCKTFHQMTPPTICSICGDLLSACKHRKQKDAQVLWALELPKTATHIRLSYLEEGQLDTLEKDMVLDKTPTLELGTLWEEYAKRTQGVNLQPRIVTMMNLDELYSFISQYCMFLMGIEADPTEFGLEREDHEAELLARIPKEDEVSKVKTPIYKGAHHHHKVP
jgi:hypothetical protein